MHVPIAAVLAAFISYDASPLLQGSLLFPRPAFATDEARLVDYADARLSRNQASPRDDSTLSAAVTLAAPAEPPDDDLDPTSEPPWNPPRATLRRRVWEQAILLPQRIVSLPLSALGAATDRSLLFIEDRNIPGRLAFVSQEIPRRTGLSLKLASLGDRTGLGGRLEARTSFLQGSFRNFVGVGHSASRRSYHDTDIRFFGRPVGIEYRYQWRPEEGFHGIGMGASEDSLSRYAAHVEHVRGSIGYYWNRDEAESPEPRTQLVAWLGPRAIVTRSGREAGTPSVEARYPALVEPTLNRTYEQLTYGVRFASDWRMGRPRWWEGWRVLVEAERFDEPSALLGLKTQRSGAQFVRTTVEMEGAYSFGRDHRTIRFLGRIEDQGISSGAERMELFDLSKLGGREGLRGFQPGRFHDIDLVLTRVTYLFSLVRRIEMEVHVESGGVFSDLWKNSRLDRFEHSAGFAIRGLTTLRPVGALGLDFSREGVRLRYSLGNPDR